MSGKTMLIQGTMLIHSKQSLALRNEIRQGFIECHSTIYPSETSKIIVVHQGCIHPRFKIIIVYPGYMYICRSVAVLKEQDNKLNVQ